MSEDPFGKKIIVSGKADKQITIGKMITSSGPEVVTSTTKGSNKVDIVFVIDTTGSMDDKIQALLATCRQFVDEAKKLELEPNFALVSFGDISVQGGGDKIETVVKLTDNLDLIKLGLTHIPRNNGFGNVGESSMEALQEALKIQHRTGAVKVIILITDEPALQHHITAPQMTKMLRQREYLVFVVATPDEYYKHMARENGGVWKEISASTNLTEILVAFRAMAKRVTEVTRDVFTYGGGSVSKYLQLKPPDKSRP